MRLGKLSAESIDDASVEAYNDMGNPNMKDSDTAMEEELSRAEQYPSGEVVKL